MEQIKKPKITYINKLNVSDKNTKKYYSIIKNYLLSYGLKSRITSTKETFRKSGPKAVLKMGGRTLKVYLPIRPEPFIEEGFKVSINGKNGEYEKYPTLIKITSKKKLETFMVVFDILMLDNDISQKKRYKSIDFTSELIPSGYDVLVYLNKHEFLVDKVRKEEIPADLVDLKEFAHVIEREKNEEIENASIYLDTLSDHFNDNDVVTRDILLSKELIRKGNGLRIRARGELSKPLTIIANEFDEDALKMIYLTNGKAVKIN